MNLKSTLLFFLIQLSILSLGNCKDDSNGTSFGTTAALLALSSSQENDPIADAASSGIDAATESMETMTTESVLVANRLPHRDSDKKSMGVRFLEILFPSLEAMDLNVSCLGGGNYTRTVTDGSDFFDASGPSATFSVTKAFHSCKFLPFGRSYHDGETQIYWNNLSASSPYIQSSTQLRIAPRRSVTNNRKFYSNFTIIGNGSSIPSPGDQKIGISVDWTSVSSSGSTYTIAINETREVQDSSGNSIVKHIVTTPSPLSVSMDKSAGTRTINGSIEIEHAISGFVVNLVYDNATWDYSNCLPVSGNISLSVTGSRAATGNIALSPGSLSFEYNSQRRNVSGTIDSAGCQ